MWLSLKTKSLCLYIFKNLPIKINFVFFALEINTSRVPDNATKLLSGKSELQSRIRCLTISHAALIASCACIALFTRCGLSIKSDMSCDPLLQSVSVCIYLNVRVFVCIYVCVYVYICVYIFTYVYICIYMYIYMYVCIYFPL